MLQDIRFALRSFNRHRGYAATAMLTVALGIGANTAVFSLADSVLLRPLPFAAAERLLVLRIGDVKTKQTYGFVPQCAVEAARASRFVDGIGVAEPRDARIYVRGEGGLDVLSVTPVSRVRFGPTCTPQAYCDPHTVDDAQIVAVATGGSETFSWSKSAV